MGKHIEQTDITRQSMVDAFWILAKKGGKKITASAVAETAGVNRSTFYEYFSDMNDLATQIEDTVIDDIKRLIGELYIEFNLNCSYRDLAKALVPYYERLIILLKRDSDRHFLLKVQKEAVELFTSVTKDDDPMIEYEIAYVVAAFTGFLLYLDETGRRIDEDAFTEVFHTLCIHGLREQCINAEMP
jgi:AcrR family transcriptional regulator